VRLDVVVLGGLSLLSLLGLLSFVRHLSPPLASRVTLLPLKTGCRGQIFPAPLQFCKPG
jgi:hypothetical protein